MELCRYGIPEPRFSPSPTPLAGAPGHEDHRKTITAAATKKTAKTVELNEGRKPLWAAPSTINSNSFLLLGIRLGARQLRALQQGGADKPQELPKL